MNKNDLQILFDNGILNEDDVCTQLKMLKEKEILKIHPYAINQLSSGRWQTYIPDENSKNSRKEIKLSSYDKVIERLIQFYDEKQNIDSLRLCDIFDDWLDYKCKKKNNKPGTMQSNRNWYDKYVSGTKLSQMKLKDITTLDLEEWAIDVLRKYEMTAKMFNSYKIVVTGPLAYAKRKNYIPKNPWVKDELEYTHLFKSKRIRPSAEMIFYPDEIEALLKEFERGYQLNGNIANLGLTINFDLGLRVGELCALKWTDINWANETIFIQRMEDGEGEVVEYVKSDSEAGYRELVLSDNVLQILRRIRKERTVLSEFIFSDESGGRTTKTKFEHRIEKAEKAIGWKTGSLKYTHCIRRTVASRMSVSGFSIDEIRRWLGHTDKQTTLGYIYNPYREDETKNKIKKLSILSTNKEVSSSVFKKNSAI